jgi:hypothetical protein
MTGRLEEVQPASNGLRHLSGSGGRSIRRFELRDSQDFGNSKGLVRFLLCVEIQARVGLAQ